LLAKVVNDDVGSLIQRGVLGFFAGKPAPTEERLLILICGPRQPRWPSFLHAEPKRGSEWWGEDLLVTFGWACIPGVCQK